MKLHKQQLQAFKKSKSQSLFINAARRSGKTTFLREIAQNYKGNVGVLTLSEYHFKRHYSDLSNCIYNDTSSNLIIGDEVLFYRRDGRKYICAITCDIDFTKWTLDGSTFDLTQLDEIKEKITAEGFESEFGNYLNK